MPKLTITTPYASLASFADTTLSVTLMQDQYQTPVFYYTKTSFLEGSKRNFRLRCRAIYLLMSLFKLVMGGGGNRNKLRMKGLCRMKTVQVTRKKRHAHKDNGLSDSLPFIDLLIHLQVSFRAREKERGEGYLTNKNSFETPMDRSPQQLHPLLGCHRALKREREKRRGLG